MSTPNMSLVLPVDHGSADIWDTVLDAILNLIDAHDHTTGKGVKIPSAALNINADVSWASAGVYYAIKDVFAVDFQPSAAASMSSYAGAIFVNSSDNELYWRTVAGTNVKMTAGNALNVAAFTGGIGGDYSAVGALFSFDDATDRYLAQQQGSPRPWAGIALGNLDIYEQAASISNRVRQKSPAGLGASYDVTWLAALPASTVGLQISSTGQLTASNTFATLTYTTDLKYSTVKFANIPLMFNVKALTNCAQDTLGNFARIKSSAGAWFWESCAHTMWGMLTGDRLQTVTVTMGACAAGTYTMKYYKTDGTTITAIDTWTFDGTAGSGIFPHTIATPEAIAIGWIHWIEVNGPNNTPDILTEVHVSWDRP